jgi:hypothetical protein
MADEGEDDDLEFVDEMDVEDIDDFDDDLS